MEQALIEFLRTGSIGPIHCGLSEQSVLGTLGEPEAISVDKPRILKFGSLQVVIVDGLVEDIYLYFDEGQCHLPLTVGVRDTVVEIPSRFADLVKEVFGHGIPYGVDQELTFDTQVALRVGNCARVMFRRDPDAIDSIQVSARQGIGSP